MLTEQQKTTLKAAILADPVLAAMASGPGTDRAALAAALNADASPVTKAWLVAVPVDDADESADYSTFDSIAAGKRDSWGFFLRTPRNFARNKVRKWITDVWGNATAGSNSESILQSGLENASRAEVILGGTTKTTGTVSALDRSWIGELSIEDIAAITA